MIIVGGGPEKKRLQRKANSNIKFKGIVSNDELKRLYQRCKAFVYIAEEDFGMVMAEAQAMGKPVIAWNKGGAKEIVADGKTGILFQEQTKESLAKANLENEKNFKKFDS